MKATFIHYFRFLLCWSHYMHEKHTLCMSLLERGSTGRKVKDMIQYVFDGIKNQQF